MNGTKKVFAFNVDNMVDIITNSSSELFVLKSDNKEVITALLESVYPNFRKEYDEPIQYRDLVGRDFVSAIHNLYGWSNEKEHCIVFPGFKFEDIYEESEYNHKWRPIEYRWKDGFIESNKEAIMKAIDPNNQIWLLYSLDENPNWDMQERLMEVATRYHLG
jgi:hypothetical protein